VEEALRSSVGPSERVMINEWPGVVSGSVIRTVTWFSKTTVYQLMASPDLSLWELLETARSVRPVSSLFLTSNRQPAQ
jgi:hypothetical protein